jgi:hypothetical protein
LHCGKLQVFVVGVGHGQVQMAAFVFDAVAGEIGDLVAVNGNDGNAVEVSTAGHQVATLPLLPNGAGDLFGVTLVANGQGLLFGDDGTKAPDRSSSYPATTSDTAVGN